MNATTKTVTTLECETCSRCGGSGRYSYCQMYGDKCFKCFGKGKVLTKRGSAANAFLRNLRSKPASEIRPGDVYLLNGIPEFGGDKWVTVQAVNPDPLNPGLISIVGDVTNYHTTPDSMLRVRQNEESARATFARAIEYQNTLTKTGVPRKRGAA